MIFYQSGAKLIFMQDKQSLLAKSVLEKALRTDEKNRNYTVPRSYGVYEISVATNSKRFRFGNHPVREVELNREFGNIKRIGLFLERADAKTLAILLNQ